MLNQAEADFRDTFAPQLFEGLTDILKTMKVSAHVSYSTTEEVVVHFWRDIERLYAIHHEQVNATKSCSYISFWVRKLKPISDAYPTTAISNLSDEGVPPHFAEITDINEQVAVFLALRVLRNAIEEYGAISVVDMACGAILDIFDRVTDAYLTSEVEDNLSMGLRFEMIVYDMRFRTYGPHHLTHILTHIMREVYQECEK